MDPKSLLERLRIAPTKTSKKLHITTPRVVNTQLIGSFRSMVKGRGLEFEGYRKYIPGHDDASDIDWRATARSNEILVKEFKEERNINIMFMVDGGSNMAFSSTEKLKVEYAMEVIATLAYNSLVAGDRVGLVIYGDRMREHILPGGGKTQYYKIMKAITDLSNYGGSTDPTQALKYIITRLRRNSILFIVSDFIYPPSNMEGALRMASLKFDTIGLVVRDPRDMHLPKEGVGEVVIKDPITGETLLFDPSQIWAAYERIAQEQLEEVKNTFFRSKAGILELYTNEDFLPKLIEFFSTRTTRWK